MLEWDYLNISMIISIFNLFTLLSWRPYWNSTNYCIIPCLILFNFAFVVISYHMPFKWAYLGVSTMIFKFHLFRDRPGAAILAAILNSEVRTRVSRVHPLDYQSRGQGLPKSAIKPLPYYQTGLSSSATWLLRVCLPRTV